MSFLYKIINLKIIRLYVLIMICHMFVFHVNGFSQSITITGVVTEVTGEIIPGANVIIKGTTTGTVSGENGRYTITVPGRDAVLEFSFIGFTPQEITVGNQTTINVTLQEASKELEEVVVVGYATMRKSDVTGSVQRIVVDDKATDAIVNVTLALSGVAGINLDQTGGSTGGGSYTIRGRSTLSGSRSPLLVVDGFVYHGSLNDFHVDDIETIDILKDASATAVYGYRASAGVILVTTKKGMSGKPVVGVNVAFGFQGMTNNPMRVMDGEEFATGIADWYWQESVYKWYATKPTSAAGRPARPDMTNREFVSNYLKTPEERANYMKGPDQAIDWVDEVLQRGEIQNYNINLRGGNRNTRHFTSLSYRDVKGIQKFDRRKFINLLNNTETKVNDWLTLALETRLGQVDYPSARIASLSNARAASPWVNNKIGQADYDIYLGGELFQPYPLVYQYIRQENISRFISMSGRASFKLPFIEGLSYDLSYSYSHSVNTNNTFHSNRTPQGAGNNGLAVKAYSDWTSWNFQNVINYVRAFNDKHRVHATLLFFSREMFKGNATNAQNQQFENDALIYNSLGQGTMPAVSSTAYEQNTLSYFGRVNYTYLNRYLFTATLRRDGCSVFGEDNKFGVFPSVGVGWIVSEEPFMNKFDFYLKARGSFGVAGNQGISRYSTMSRMTLSQTVFDGVTYNGLYPDRLSNTELGWETTNQFNLGFDFSFLNNRLSGTIDAYMSKTPDVLVVRALPPTTGYANVTANIGKLSGKGGELSLVSENIKKSSFKWKSGFNFSIYRDKIDELYGGESDSDIVNGWFQGKPISAIYDYEVQGIWQEDEFFAGKCYDGWYPGQFKYADLNEDGSIHPDQDRKIVGYKDRNYTFGIYNELSYKNFSFSFYINSIQGGKDYYRGDNQQNITPRFYYSDRHNNSAVNSYWSPEAPTDNTTGIYNLPLRQPSGVYQNRSFVRLQDITLQYKFSKKMLEKIKISSAAIYVSSHNPYTWTKWQGWDPEIGTSDTPLMRNIMFGFRLSL